MVNLCKYLTFNLHECMCGEYLTYMNCFQTKQIKRYFGHREIFWIHSAHLDFSKTGSSPNKYLGKLYSISIIPKPELRGFWGDSLTKPPFKVTNRRVIGRYNLPRNIWEMHLRRTEYWTMPVAAVGVWLSHNSWPRISEQSTKTSQPGVIMQHHLATLHYVSQVNDSKWPNWTK